MLDVKTGEVLALANRAHLQPEQSGHAEGGACTQSRHHRSVRAGFDVEAIHRGCRARIRSGQPGEHDRRPRPAISSWAIATIHDAHPEGLLTVAQVIQKSSNVGVAKLALAMAPREAVDHSFRGRVRAPPRVGFPGEARGRLRAYQRWRPIEQATMSYGHGISVSLLQLARAYTVFATDGELQPLTLVKRDQPVRGKRVISPAPPWPCAGCSNWWCSREAPPTGAGDGLSRRRQDRHRA